MDTQAEISAEHIRKHLLDRATAYSERTGIGFSRISEEAIRDSKFLANVQSGSNFTIKTYQRVIDWLDEAEAAPSSASAA